MDIHRQLNGDAIRQELLKQYSKCGFGVFFSSPCPHYTDTLDSYNSFHANLFSINYVFTLFRTHRIFFRSEEKKTRFYHRFNTKTKQLNKQHKQ